MEEKNSADSDSHQPSKYDGPSAKLWSAYFSKAEKHSKSIAQNWKGDMDALLIFAGLFSASLTAFIIESYKDLNIDPQVMLLAQISEQLASISSSPLAVNVTSMNPASFVPPASAVICNGLWFLSLAFSLSCALGAILVEQWTRHYLHAPDNRPAPHDRARISAYVNEGIHQFKMSAVVEIIPMLLHVSLFLFFAGLVVFLHPVNPVISYLVLGMLFLCCSLYMLVTVLPILYHNCPYRTPLSTLWWTLLQKLHLLHRTDIDGNIFILKGSMEQEREIDAVIISNDRDRRDLEAIQWTLDSFWGASEFEPFVEVVPSVIAGYDYSAKLLIYRLLHCEERAFNLTHLVPLLLGTCTGGLMEESQAQRRAITCLKAIWSLTMLSMPTPRVAYLSAPRANLRFKEETLSMLNTIRNEIPTVDSYSSSTTIVVARSLLDLHVDRTQAFHEQLSSLLSSTPNIDDEKSWPDINSKDFKHRFNILQGVERQMQELEKYIQGAQSLTIPKPFVMMEAVAAHHTRLVSIAAAALENMDTNIVHDTLRSLNAFIVLLNQAGFYLALEYVKDSLNSSLLPHEAFNTMRRAFFRTDSGIAVSREAQCLLVKYLDVGTNQGPTGATKLPQKILDILLEMTRFLNDPACVLKTKGIVTRYERQYPSDAGSKTLTWLHKAFPDDLKPDPTLELFQSHMYANSRIEGLTT